MLIEKINLLSRLDSVSARILVNTLDKADHRGLLHGLCVAEIAYSIGEAFNHPRFTADELWLTGLMHDIGLIGIPKAITENKGKLTTRQRKYIQQHSKLSRFIIERMFDAPEMARAALCHHERYDGAGYPLGLSGEDIPFMARVISIADAYETMRSASWVLKKKSHNKALAELAAEAGSQFDPDIVKQIRLNPDPLYVSYEKARQLETKDILERF